MTEGPPDADDSREDGPVLAPEELDISGDDHVEQIDDGRFVISPDGRPQSADSGSDTVQREPDDAPRSDSGEETDAASRSDSREDATSRSGSREEAAPRNEINADMVHEWLHESFADNDTKYGFDMTATFDGSVAQRRMVSNDVVTIFESLLLWYAQQIDTDTPVEDILGILLVESNVPVRFPPESLQQLVNSTDLDPGDTIADLIAAVDEQEGVNL